MSEQEFEQLRETVFRPRCGLCDVVILGDYEKHFKSKVHLLNLIKRKKFVVDMPELSYKVDKALALPFVSSSITKEEKK